MRCRCSKAVPSFMVHAAARRNQRFRSNSLVCAMPAWIWLAWRRAAWHRSLQNALAAATSTPACLVLGRESEVHALPPRDPPRSRYWAVKPPSTGKTVPVTHDDSSEAR